MRENMDFNRNNFKSPTSANQANTGFGRGKFHVNQENQHGNEFLSTRSSSSCKDCRIPSKNSAFDSCNPAVGEIGASSQTERKLNALTSKRPCIGCGQPSTKRCSVCKAGYCSEVCQQDNWYEHMPKCSPPPPLEERIINIQMNGISTKNQTNGEDSLSCSSLSEIDPKYQQSGVSNLKQPPKSAEHLNASSSQANMHFKSPLKSKMQDRNGHFSADLTDKLREISVEPQNSRFIRKVDVSTNQSGNDLKSLRLPGQTLSGKSEARSEFCNNPPNSKSFPKSRPNGMDSNTVPKRELNDIASNSVPKRGPNDIGTNSVPKRGPNDIGSNSVPKRGSNDIASNSVLKSGPNDIASNSVPKRGSNEIKSPELVDITQKMKPKSEYNCVRLFIKSNEIFALIVITDDTKVLEETLQDVNFNASTLLLSSVSVGDVLLAQSIEDESLYRAIVTSTLREDKVEVCFVDYGNKEWVSRLMCLPSHLDLNSIPALAIEARFISNCVSDTAILPNVLADTQIIFRIIDNKNGKVTAYLLDSGMREIASYSLIPILQLIKEESGLNKDQSQPCEQHILPSKVEAQIALSSKPRQKVSQKPVSAFISNSVTVSQQDNIVPKRAPLLPDPVYPRHPNYPAPIGPRKRINLTSNKVCNSLIPTNKKYFKGDIEEQTLDIGKEYKGLIIWSTPESIYCQIENGMESYTNMVPSIQKHCSQAVIPENVVEGELVCALSPEEATFYRAEIVSVLDKDKVVVRFIDYGNQEESRKADLRVFHPSFTSIKVFAVKLLPDDGSPSDVLQYIVESAMVTIVPTAQNPLRGHVIAEGEKIWPLKEKGDSPPSDSIKNEDQSPQQPPPVATEQLKTGAVKPVIKTYEDYNATSLPVAKGVEVVVLHSSGPQSVFVIAKENVGLFNDLEVCTQEMNEYCNSIPSPYYEPKEGEICMAKFTEDDAWYRATCVCVDGDTATMFFVDYGNVDTVRFDRLVQMVDKFGNIDLLAVHCRVKGFDMEDMGRGTDFLDKFNSLLPTGSTLCVDVIEKDEYLVYEIDIPSLASSFKNLRQ